MDTKFVKRVNFKLLLTALLFGVFGVFGVTASEPALAHGRGGARVSVGFYVGAPFYAHPFYADPFYRHYYYAPYYGYAPYYYPPAYYPPVVVAPAAPTVYVEQAAPQQQLPAVQAPPQAPAAWWYYCAQAQAYYPYVRQCPGGWQRVSPQPPG